MIVAHVVGVAFYVGVSWLLLAAIKWGMLLAFEWSPFSANGVEILVGALLLFVQSIYVDLRLKETKHGVISKPWGSL